MQTNANRVLRAVQMAFCDRCGRTMQTNNLWNYKGKMVCWFPCWMECAEEENEAARQEYYDRNFHAGRGGY